MIGIINNGMGNMTSVVQAFKAIGAEIHELETPAMLDRCSRLVLPGVGAFEKAMANLIAGNWVTPLRLAVIEHGIPFLGICLGMQLLAEQSEEFGNHQGLGWIRGAVKRIIPRDSSLVVPQVGWNDVSYPHPSRLFEHIPEQSDFYFVHSFQLIPEETEIVTGITDYGGTVTASIEKNNIFAAQFHPEKSGRAGLQLLRNFANV